MAGQNRADVDQHRAASAAVAGAMPQLGRSIGRAIDTYDKTSRCVVVGTGGLSHQLDGKRAGFINKEFDLLCLDEARQRRRRRSPAIRS